MATEAQIRANQNNSRMSTGPRSEAGKAASRANAITHGLTSVKVLPELEAEEVQRRFRTFCGELNPSGEVGFTFVLRAATLSARMERCVQYETAVLAERVRRTEADFVAPEGVDAATAARLRDEAGKRALFDDSKAATLARKYEAAAERGFYRALKELRQHEKAVQAAEHEEIGGELGSFSPEAMSDEEFDKFYAETMASEPRMPVPPPLRDDFEALKARVDVPISIGKRR